MKKLLYACRSKFKLLTATLLAVSSLATAQADEFRGVWVDAWGAGFLNASQVTTLVNQCRTYNFNAVIVQMRRRGDAFYMPQAPNGDPRTTALASGYDALQELINQCHSGTPRIEVHCWVPAQLIWADTVNSPSQPGHVYNLHPEYLMKNSSGATFMAEGYYLDPGHPGAAQWNYNMAKDIVSRYNIDGFHWDYIRYPQQDSGYNATAIARYNTEFGLTGQPLSSNTQFSNWRRRQVTDFLRWANADLLAIKPNLVISASVFASRSDALNARFQDWAAWNNEGLYDLCFPMNYTADNNVFNTRTDDAYLNQGVRRVYMGPGAYLNTKENTVVQLNYSRNKPLLGTSFFSYRTPNSGTVDQTGTFTYVKNNYQPTWQNVPSLPWKASPTKGILKGTVTRQDTGAIVYNATLSVNTSPVRTQKSEAHGKYAFFETTPGTYTVTASASGFPNATGIATVTAGGVVTLNLAFGTADTTPPVISNVGSSLVTDSTARITWTTDENSDSAVNYGTTTSYGTTVSDASLVTSHTINLSGLNPSTLYNFRVRSKDGSNNEAVSGNFTFTTAAAGVTEIIIDNPAATVVGSWSSGTGATDKYGTDYRFKSGVTPGSYLQYTPNIPAAGSYQVYQWHPAGSNRTTNAPYVINYSGGSATVRVNQQVNGGKWNLLGTYNFAAGTSGNVRLQDDFADTTQVVMADAVRFVSLGVTIPTAPSGLSATSISSSQINLAWTDNSSNEDNFIVARSTTSGGPYTDIATLGSNVTSFNNTGLSANTTYYYVVRASNSGGASANSNQASATTAQNPPAAPSNLTATTVSQTQINLSWTDNSSNESNFIVGRSTTSGGPYTDIATLGANVTSFNNTGLIAGTTYYYVVRASNSGGSSANSAQASATTLPNAPAAPSGLTATAVSGTQINLAWIDNSSNESNFVVARSTTSGGPYTDIATLGANVTSFNNTGLSTGVTYHYVVRASNAGGTSANSAQASATTISLPAAPSGLTATAVRATRIDLAWVDNSGNESGFVISRSTTSGGPYTDVATVGANVTSYNNTGLTANTTYFYVVRATNSVGSSANSAQASATTLETDLLVDNKSAVVVGSWTVATSAADKYNSNYLFASQGTGNSYVQFTPWIATAGSYQVYTWHPQGSNRTTNAPHVINYNGGSETVYMNQKVNGGNWNLLGTFPFANGNTGNIRITDAFADAGQVVMADAIRLIYVSAPTAPSALAATAVNQQRIDLTWTDNSTNEDNFVVARSTTSGGPYTDIAVLSANSTAFSNTGLAQNTTYYYVIRARNASGSSANTAQASAKTKRAVRVQSITMSWVLSSSKYKSRATVVVTDTSGATVPSATVTGNFTGAYTNNGRTGTTSSTGTATITSTSSITKGTVTFSVTNITGTDMQYLSGSNIVTSATHSR
ncbi:MAG: fibronectin type III domain-containing protein [Verrucomicrobia bacterium]|nr:fibronectin type III domain-containing protein [Verrucomicrobiota bacterium]